MLKNLRLPKKSNSDGNRALVVTRSFASKGEQLKSFDKEDLVVKNSFDLFL